MTSPSQATAPGTLPQSTAVIDELEAAFDQLAPYSDNDEAYFKHAAYGLLAILWGYRPWLDNLDYRGPGFPEAVTLEEFDDYDRIEWELTIQAPALGQVWCQVYNIVHSHGPAATLAALVAAATTTDHEERPTFAWYVHAKWSVAAEAYGWDRNPYGLIYDEAHGPRLRGSTVDRPRRPGPTDAMSLTTRVSQRDDRVSRPDVAD